MNVFTLVLGIIIAIIVILLILSGIVVESPLLVLAGVCIGSLGVIMFSNVQSSEKRYRIRLDEVKSYQVDTIITTINNVSDTTYTLTIY